MQNGIERAIEKAGGKPGGVTAIANAIGTSPQFVTNQRRKGWLPLDKARIVSDTYGIPLVELVRKDIAAALRSQS